MGPNEDYSLGDSPSDSSEKLLWRGGGHQYIYDFTEGGLFVIRHTFWQVTASHKEQMPPLMILVFF